MGRAARSAPSSAPGPVTAAGSAGAGSGGSGSPPHSPALRQGKRRARRLRDWPLRSRLLLLIAFPTLAAIILGGIRIYSSAASAVAFQRAEERAVLASDITNLAQQLETERDQTVYYIALGGRVGHQSPGSNAGRQLRAIDAFYQQTDQAVRQLRAGLAKFGGAYPAGSQQQVTPALGALSTLPYLRHSSIKSQMPEMVVFQKYTNVLDSLFQVEDQTAQGSGDPALAQTVDVLGLVSRTREEASEQRGLLSAALLQGHLTQPEAAALSKAAANQQASQETFDLSATTSQRVLWNNTVSGSFVYLAASDEQQAASLQARTHSLTGDSLTADAFYDAMSNGINTQMGSVERTLVNNVINRSNSLRGRALTSALLVGAAVLAILTLALVCTVLVARSMVGPLRRLSRGAIEIAGVGLPRTVRRISEGHTADIEPEVAPFDVDSTDEIGDVARAFDQVHREAVRLASTEAALRSNVNSMFVNLSRRSQSLVERQIHLIDDMEQGEQDAERLGSLFQLDHLATRMRRNSENLLVLAGHETPRAWRQAVPLLDVLRAAVSEIERYERVSLNVQPGIAVRGQAVNDLVHLVAELVENATSFSPTDAPVAVSGQLLTSGGVLLDITDQGVGMGAEDMAHANWRLDKPPVVDVTVSRRMGLFVVARLAARHGIRVRLRSAATGGLTALVWLPDEVVSVDHGAGRLGLRGFESSAPAATPTAGLALGSADGGGLDRPAWLSDHSARPAGASSRAAEPAGRPAESTGWAVEPTERPAESTGWAVEPTERPAESTGWAVEPTERPAEFTGWAVGPTGRAARFTDQAADSTAQSAGPRHASPQAEPDGGPEFPGLAEDEAEPPSDPAQANGTAGSAAPSAGNGETSGSGLPIRKKRSPGDVEPFEDSEPVNSSRSSWDAFQSPSTASSDRD
jgi:signal transduction histidine kinase